MRFATERDLFTKDWQDWNKYVQLLEHVLRTEATSHCGADWDCLTEGQCVYWAAKSYSGMLQTKILCKNVDVDDGLINGACDTVTGVALSDDPDFPTAVYVQFGDLLTGS